MTYEHYFAAHLEQLKAEGRYRTFADLERISGQFPKAIWRKTPEDSGQLVTIWCGNDYLGMGQHPAVVQAMQQAVATYGAGAGGTRNISGTTHLHVELEAELASLHGKEAALLFTSGYISNQATLSTLGRVIPGLVIFSDELNHASMIEGIRQSKAEYHVFRHNDLAHLRQLLDMVGPDCPKLIAFESVYSMDGDFAPLTDLCALAEEYNAMTYLDEVHAVGMYGDHGAGVAEATNCAHRLTIIEGTLGKAYGVMGGYIASSRLLVDAIRSSASGFIFTTSLVPAVCAGALASIRHLRHSSTERSVHQARAAHLKAALKAAGLPVMDSPSHIVPVMVGDPVNCKAISRKLLEEHGLYVQPINYPTVPRGTERLRFTPSPAHSEDDIRILVNALRNVWSEVMGRTQTGQSTTVMDKPTALSVA